MNGMARTEGRKYSHTAPIREQINLVKMESVLYYSGTLVCAYRAAPLVPHTRVYNFDKLFGDTGKTN
jgi:hypothetical protein